MMELDDRLESILHMNKEKKWFLRLNKPLEDRLRQIIEGVEDLGVFWKSISIDFARQFSDYIIWNKANVYYFSLRPEFVKEFYHIWDKKGLLCDIIKEENKK